jgi:hypothetical protein
MFILSPSTLQHVMSCKNQTANHINMSTPTAFLLVSKLCHKKNTSQMKFSIALTLALSSISPCAAYSGNVACFRGNGSNKCYVSGIEGTHCGGKGSNTRDCNLAGNNCNWCDIDTGGDYASYKDIEDNLTRWCTQKGGSTMGFTSESYPDC